MGDINQHQTIYLTPCTKEGQLLQRTPESWDEFKDGLFLMINGQHNIITLKLLQDLPAREACKIELQTWKTYIVWTLKKNQLLWISEWYNACNHLKHLQSTWGSNIMSTLWLSYGRPTLRHSRAGADRKNDAVYNVEKFKVRQSYFHLSVLLVL